MIGSAVLYAASAPVLSFAAIAVTTFLIAVRSIERELELRALRLTA
jgi:hypothetical protein